MRNPFTRYEFWFGTIVLIALGAILASYADSRLGLILPIAVWVIILVALVFDTNPTTSRTVALSKEAKPIRTSPPAATFDTSAIESLLHKNYSASTTEQRKILSELASLRKEIDTLKHIPAAQPFESTPISEEKLGELSGSLSEAMKQISVRDTQIDILATNVNRANIQRNLVRLTQVLEVARSLKARVASGKSDAKDSFDFIVDDMDSALTDQGVEAFEVAVGARVAELPAGSFAAISVVDAPEDSLRGTVKEVRSRCYFIPEEGKKPRYIAPAKVILYRA